MDRDKIIKKIGLEEIEDANEIQHLRELGEEVIPWEQAKAELRADGVDV